MTPHIELPLFCPRRSCRYYDRALAASECWYMAFGSFFTKARGDIRRFRCKSCGKTCSTQTFSIHYWTHSTSDYPLLFQKLYSASGLRQHGRFTNSSFRVVQNRIRHLSRNCLALLDRALSAAPLGENLCMDGFESFTRSQYFPNNITMLVGERSQCIYGAVHTLLRRKGRMSAVQRHNRAMIDAHWRPAAGAVRGDCRQLLGDCAPMIGEAAGRSRMSIATDLHPAYRPAMRDVPELARALDAGTLSHIRVSSRRARTRTNPLFPVNYVDRQIRKNMGEHVRETVKQGREVNCQMERMAIFLVGHNFLTPHRIRDGVNLSGDPTHGQVAGLEQGLPEQELGQLFTHRQIWGHQRLKVQWQRRIWAHQYENPPAVNLNSGDRSPTVVALGPGQLAAHYLA